MRPASTPDERLPYGRTDDVFRHDALRGDAAARLVAIELLLAGLNVQKQPLALRPDRAQAAQYDDGGVDLYVGSYPIQVKLRSAYRFSGPADFPFPTVIFDSRAGFERHVQKPVAYVLVSGDLHGYVVVPRRAYAHAQVEVRQDQTRNAATREFLACPIEHVWSIHDLISAARTLPGCRSTTTPATEAPT